MKSLMTLLFITSFNTFATTSNTNLSDLEHGSTITVKNSVKVPNNSSSLFLVYQAGKRVPILNLDFTKPYCSIHLTKNNSRSRKYELFVKNIISNEIYSNGYFVSAVSLEDATAADWDSSSRQITCYKSRYDYYQAPTTKELISSFGQNNITIKYSINLSW